MAGERTSARSWGTGFGMARMARVKGERHPRAGQAAGVAGVVKGRQAHPPRAEKNIYKHINKKEKRLALASAIAATAIKELVQLRGHKVEDVPSLPLVVVDKLQSIARVKDLLSTFEKLGLKEELKRLKKGVKRLSGKPRMRGRTKREPKGPLIVVAKDEGIGKAAQSIPGVECVLAKDLSVVHLAPGSHPARLVVWTKSALSSLPKQVLSLGERFEG